MTSMADGLWRRLTAWCALITSPVRVAWRALPTWWALTVWCAAVSTLVMVAVGSSWWYFDEVNDTATEIRDRDGQMIVEVSLARNALVAAQASAINSFRSGQAELTGPGQDYYQQLTIVGQSLTQAAESNSLGPTGSDRLQTVESLLSAYEDSVNQAAAYFRAGNRLLGTVALWNSWRIVEDEGAVLDKLQDLRDEQEMRLVAQQSTQLVITGQTAVWVLANLLALALLVYTQRRFYRRFHRRLNICLVLTTTLLLAVCCLTGYAVVTTDQESTTAADSLRVVLRESFAETPYALRDFSRQEMSRLVNAHCDVEARACGQTVQDARFLSVEPSDLKRRKDLDAISQIRDLTNADVYERDARAGLLMTAQWSWWWWGYPLVMVGLPGLLYLGFRPRLNEYWFRSR